MGNFKDKISYVLNRAFVSAGKAPTLTITLLQLIAIILLSKLNLVYAIGQYMIVGLPMLLYGISLI